MIACAMDGIDGLRSYGWCMEKMDENNGLRQCQRGWGQEGVKGGYASYIWR